MLYVLLLVLVVLTGNRSRLRAQTSTSFGPGSQIVGSDIAAGSYRSQGGDGCYWERLSAFGGIAGEIVANAIQSRPAVVTIAASDAGFNSHGRSTWTQGLSAITASVDDPFSNGTFVASTDNSQGPWRTKGVESCY